MPSEREIPGVRIHQMFEQPEQFLTATLPRYMEKSMVSCLEQGEFLSATIERIRQKQILRWQERLGIHPSEIRTTVIMPVHDEQRMLPSFLGALMMSDIPDCANIDFLFVVNGCTDSRASLEILKQFLGDLGEVGIEPHGIKSDDELLQVDSFVVKRNNLTFRLILTDKASKSHALNIGNDYALSKGHNYALSLEANNWLEPDTICEMVANIHEHVVSNKDTTTVVGVTPIIAFPRIKSPISRALVHLSNPPEGKPLAQAAHDVTGWGMAWDTDWVRKIGGFPPIAVDDYSIGLLARLDGKKIDHPNARMWGFTSNSLTDRVRENVKWMRGYFQLLDYIRTNFPELYTPAEKLIHSEREQTWPLRGRLHVLMYYILHHPEKMHAHLARFLWTEIVRVLAVREYLCDPHNETWPSLSSKK